MGVDTAARGIALQTPRNLIDSSMSLRLTGNLRARRLNGFLLGVQTDVGFGTLGLVCLAEPWHCSAVLFRVEVMPGYFLYGYGGCRLVGLGGCGKRDLDCGFGGVVVLAISHLFCKMVLEIIFGGFLFCRLFTTSFHVRR